MSYSIYDVSDASDVAKPAEVLDSPVSIEEYYSYGQPSTVELDTSIGNNENETYYSEFQYNYNPVNIFEDSIGHDLIAKENLKKYIKSKLNMYSKSSNLIYKNIKGNNKVAIPLDLLVSWSRGNSKLVTRAQNCSLRLIKGDIQQGVFNYWVSCGETYSNKDGHVVSIMLDNSEKNYDITKLDIKVSCSCEFWQFKGPNFNSDNMDYDHPDYDSSAVDSRVPVKRYKPEQRPLANNFICKHVYAVSKKFEQYVVKHKLDVDKEISNIIRYITGLSRNIQVVALETLLEKIETYKKIPSYNIITLKNSVRDYSKGKNKSKLDEILELIVTSLSKLEKEQVKEIGHILRNRTVLSPNITTYIDTETVDILKNKDITMDSIKKVRSTLTKLTRTLKELVTEGTFPKNKAEKLSKLLGYFLRVKQEDIKKDPKFIESMYLDTLDLLMDVKDLNEPNLKKSSIQKIINYYDNRR